MPVETQPFHTGNGHARGNGHAHGDGRVHVDIQRIAGDALRHAHRLVPAWLPSGTRKGREWIALNPTRADNTPGSFKINLDTGRWSDFATEDGGGDLVSLRAYLDRCSQVEAAMRVAAEIGTNLTAKTEANLWKSVKPSPAAGEKGGPVIRAPRAASAPELRHFKLGAPSASWAYHAVDGAVHHMKARYEEPDGGKTFLLWRWTGSRWACGAPAKPFPLYNLPALMALPDAPVLVCEGEKCADIAANLFPNSVTVTSGGDNSAGVADWTPLAGRDVVVWPDHDAPGTTYCDAVVRHATEAGARSIRAVSAAWLSRHVGKDLAKGYDAADAVEDGFTADAAAAALVEHDAALAAFRASYQEPVAEEALIDAARAFAVEFKGLPRTKRIEAEPGLLAAEAIGHLAILRRADRNAFEALCLAMRGAARKAVLAAIEERARQRKAAWRGESERRRDALAATMLVPLYARDPGLFGDGWPGGAGAEGEGGTAASVGRIDARPARDRPENSWLPSCYRFRWDGGLEFEAGEDEDGDPIWQWLCSEIEIAARTSNADAVEHGLLVRVHDQQNGRWHEWAMPKRLLAGDGNAYRAELFAMGLEMPLTVKARNAFAQLLMTAHPETKFRCVDRTGWHGKTFVLPSSVIGPEDERAVVFQSARPVHAKFRASGTLAEWQDHVAAPSAGNSRLVFSLSVAFAAPLLKLAGQEGGGIHWWGHSSGGKTTCLTVAGSVWGGGGVKGYVDNWKNTVNGIEGRAAGHCDALLCLQELGQADPDAAAEAAYMLANGQGKGRGNVEGGGTRKTAEWRVLFLSDGELTLDDKIREGRRGRRMAGQAVRVLDIPADAGQGLGAFDRVPDSLSARQFSERLCEAATAYYGTAALAFVERIVADAERVPGTLKESIEGFVAETAAGASPQVERAAKRFGLIAAAGEMAIRWSIVPWTEGDATAAARRCFAEWLKGRGTTGPLEDQQALEHVRSVIERDGASRFVPWHDPGRVVYDRLGFVKLDTVAEGEPAQTFYVTPEGWRELCRGFSPGRVAADLARRGILETGGDGKPQVKTRLPGVGSRRCYVIDAGALFSDGEHGEQGERAA